MTTTVYATKGIILFSREAILSIYHQVPFMIEIPDRHLFFVKEATLQTDSHLLVLLLILFSVSDVWLQYSKLLLLSKDD